MDLWVDLQAVIGTCDQLINSGKLEGGDLAEALRHQGDAYFRSFRVDLAFENYKRALELKPDWPRALWNLGNAAAVLGYGELAMQSERRAVEVDPTYSNPHAAIAIFLSNTGDSEGSLKEFDRAIELDPKNYLARYNRALTYNTLGRHLDALHECDALLREDETALNRTYFHWRPEPDKDFVGEIQRERAIIFKTVGSIDEALTALQSAIDRKPGFATVVIFRSQLIRGFSDYKPLYGEALAAIDRALALHPDSPEVPDLVIEKVSLLMAMGKNPEAVAILTDTSRFEQSARAAFFMDRSYVWEDLKEFDRAQADMIAAMRMDRWYFQESIRNMQEAGYLMGWPGLDPRVAMANAISACVHDAFC
jgi:tetratricopeptide (TPR) repeat protein